MLRPEYGRYPNNGLTKVTIECPLNDEVLDTYYFRKSEDGYARLSKEWKRYSVIYPVIDGLEWNSDKPYMDADGRCNVCTYRVYVWKKLEN